MLPICNLILLDKDYYITLGCMVQRKSEFKNPEKEILLYEMEVNRPHMKSLKSNTKIPVMRGHYFEL